MDAATDFEMEDLIPEEDMVVTISKSGYIKSLPLSVYRSQRRGGKGITGSGMKEGDIIEHLFVASTHDTILVFTNRGKVYGIKVYRLPKLPRQSKGRAVRNIIEMDAEEHIASVLAVRDFEDGFVLLATRNGVVKKTDLSAFANSRTNGKIAINIDVDDRLVGADLTCGQDNIFLATRDGMALKFHEKDARPMGRATRGVIGIKLREGDELVSLSIVRPGSSVFTACELGYGKQTPFTQYRLQRRGGKGIINIKTSSRNGGVVAVLNVTPEDSVLMITARGMVVRTPVVNISSIGRATLGVRIITLKKGDKLRAAARVLTEEEVDAHCDPDESDALPETPPATPEA